MKRLWFALVCAAALALAATSAPSAKLRVYEKDGTTMVPFRFVAEWMGATVGFDAASGNVTLAMADRTVAFKLGSKSAKVNGKPLALSVAPAERDGVTYVPVRFLADGLGAQVAWSDLRQEVTVTHPAVAQPLPLLRQMDGNAWSAGMHLAAYADSPTLIQRYLDAGELVDEQDSFGNTALVVAVIVTRARAAQLLLDKGAAIDVKMSGEPLLSFFPPSTEKGRLFECACSGGAAGMDRAVLASWLALGVGAAVPVPPVNPDAALIVSAMIARGADVNAANGRVTPLMDAAMTGDLPIARVLIDKGADVKAKIEGGTTALHIAAGCGSLDIAKLLLEKGADVNAKETNGATPLAWAKQAKRDAIVAFLIEKGGKE